MTKARSNATANAAKGDLTVGSGTNLSSVLGVGSNGETIVADSSTTTGLRYQGNFAAGKNKIINGDFGIWQRGTSITIPSGYGFGPDRFQSYSYASNTTTISRQTFTPGTAPVAGYEGQYFCRILSTNGGNPLEYRVEDVRTLAGQTVTFSFWAKSATAQSITNGITQNFGAGGSSDVYVLSSGVAITTSWARYSYTVSMPSISGKTVASNSFLQLSWNGAINNALDIWGVQLEAGSVATAFQTATGTIQGELDACRRYFVRYGGNTSTEFFGTGMAYAAGSVFLYVPHRPFMRTSPVGTFAAGSNFRMFNSTMSGAAAATTVAADVYSPTGSTLLITGGSGLTAGNASSIQSSLTTNATLDFSAEL
jgi:hypothetical protein